MHKLVLAFLCLATTITTTEALAQWGGPQGDSSRVAPASDSAAEPPVPLRLELRPSHVLAREGEPVRVALLATGGADSTYRFSIITGPEDAELSANGTFTWTPGYDFVRGNQDRRQVHVVAAARDAAGHTDVQPLRIEVQHVNRPPLIPNEVVLSVKPETPVTFEIPVRDDDGDPLTFTATSRRPSGATLSQEGVFTWTPSHTQYQGLPATIGFTVSDGAETVRDQLRLVKWDGGLPPSITVIRGTRDVREGETVVLEVKASDPDGFENIEAYGVSDLPAGSDWTRDGAVGRFTWTPDYTVVPTGQEQRSVKLDFFVRDIDGMNDETNLTFAVQAAPDPTELFRQYRQTLASATSTIDQLVEKRRLLMDKRQRAESRRKVRSIAKIFFGSSTALFGLFTNEGVQRWGTSLSGAATATLAGLETANVFKSPTEYDKDIESLTTSLVSLQTEAELFARNFNAPDKRTGSKFSTDAEMLTSVIKGVRAKYETVESPLVKDEDIKRVTIYYTTN